MSSLDLPVPFLFFSSFRFMLGSSAVVAGATFFFFVPGLVSPGVIRRCRGQKRLRMVDFTRRLVLYSALLCCWVSGLSTRVVVTPALLPGSMADTDSERACRAAAVSLGVGVDAGYVGGRSRRRVGG